MERWEKELQQRNLQKAVNTEFGYNMPIEDLLEKAAPIGTRKTWQGGREFVKTAEGWKPVPKKDRQLKGEEEKKSDGVVISDPDKFKVESVKTVNPNNPTHFNVDYKINGVSVCSVKKYSDAFCSIEHGRPSNIRNVRKTCYSTSWNSEGIRKVTGIEHVDVSRKSDYFRGAYPDTTWGDTGGMVSAKDVKEKIASFIKEDKLNKLVKDVPDNGRTANLMRKQAGIKEKDEFKDVPYEGKSNLSLTNLSAEAYKVKRIESRLEEVGYARHHKNFEALANAYKEFQQKGETLSKKVKDLELKFDFDAAWYDQRTHASLTGYVGANKHDIIGVFSKEYDAEKQELAKYGSTNHWLAGKLADHLSKTGVKTWGGYSSFTTSGNSVYIRIAHGELK